MLNKLEKSEIFVEVVENNTRKFNLVQFRITNPTDKISFFIYLDLLSTETGKSLIPVLWSDNYISLLPGESKNISASIPPGSNNLSFICKGWNIKEEKIYL
jgi:exo-1,4-beta-D-glucosaminidase